MGDNNNVDADMIAAALRKALDDRAAQSEEWRKSVDNSIDRLIESQTTLNLSTVQLQSNLVRIEEKALGRIDELEKTLSNFTLQYAKAIERLHALEIKQAVGRANASHMENKIDKIMSRYVLPGGIGTLIIVSVFEGKLPFS